MGVDVEVDADRAANGNVDGHADVVDVAIDVGV